MVIKLYNLTQFSEMEEQWQELLHNSSADPLFMSWHWMYQWWKQCATPKKDELLLFIAYENDRLVGIAPFYRCKVKIKFHLYSRRILLLGTNIEGHGAFRAEYLEIIVRSGCQDVIQKIYSSISSQLKFDELYLENIMLASDTYRHLDKIGGYERQLSAGVTYTIDTTGSFEEYLKRLGKHTRHGSFNRRKLLQKHGDINIQLVERENLTHVFELLSDFQKSRWKIKPEIHNSRKQFIMAISALPELEICGIILRVNHTPIACTLDLQINGVVYNFQLAYQPDFDKKLSVGMLAITYATEHYFNKQGANSFDLLEGKGKNFDYKSHIAKTGRKITSVNLIHSAKLSILYRVYDYSKKFLQVIEALIGKSSN